MSENSNTSPMNHQAPPDQPQEAPAAAHDYTPWIDAILFVAKHYRMDFSRENIRVAAAWRQDASLEEGVNLIAHQAGLAARMETFKASKITPWRLPIVIQLTDGQVGVIESMDSDGVGAVYFSNDQGLCNHIPLKTLEKDTQAALILRPARSVADARVDDYIKPHQPHWFRKLVFSDLRPYGHIFIASFVANVLALAAIIFSRQVYDRVIPAESLNTLYVLFSGVVLALLFDFIMRRARMRISDLLGKRADMKASDRVFGHAMRVTESARPKSTGSFITQIRELESVRELLTSTTISGFADLPFFLLFCVVFWYLGGMLVLVPIVALILLLLPGLLLQGKMRRLATEAMRESSMRSGLLVEAIQGHSDIKMMQAESRFQNQWNHFNAVLADVNLKTRNLTNTLSAWSHTIQTGVFGVVVLFGAPMVMEGDLTIGSLVACSILASRMMAPMAQFNTVLGRWQQAKVGLESLDNVMKMPVDTPDGDSRVHRAALSGNYRFEKATFSYDEDAKQPALAVKQLSISAGEKIAILGRNGSGKSTLIAALAGLMPTRTGQVNLDDVSLTQLDPADLRRDVALMGQSSRLFHGSLRDNLLMGATGASDSEILNALEVSGALGFVQQLPDGLNHIILEGGNGLSSGQRQSVIFARMVLRDPAIVLMDEPTAALDDSAEAALIKRMKTWLQHRTLIMSTHRLRVLSLVDRIIVVNNGQIAMDGNKAEVLKRLKVGDRPTDDNNHANGSLTGEA